jgi:solute carrier family 27 (fatty acid transporter), member 1/4
VNIDNTVGAIGFVSRIIPSVYPISIIRADPITGEPIRGRNGLCQKCGPNEPGVFIGKITSNPSRAFLGYVDKGASDKKVVKDVFAKGDAAFLSGDVLESDERGNLYFRDRTGDTFRWKGENVSTSEVEALVSNVAGYRDTVVYGVEIPNMEGRAGMAAILDTEHSVNLETLGEHIKASLPSYARPQFIRLLTKVDLTGTFKLKKVDLHKEGYNPSQIEDPIYYLTTKGTYERLTAEIFEKIEKSEIRF